VVDVRNDAYIAEIVSVHSSTPFKQA